MAIKINQHLNLQNKFDFKQHCTRKNAEIFDRAEAQKIYPTRGMMFSILITDVFYTPFYLIKKIGEIALNIINNFLTLNKPWDIFFKVTSIPEYIVLLSLFCFIPFLCTTIRLTSTALGLLMPQLALKGWKLAEGGEGLLYRLWSNNVQEFYEKGDLFDAFDEIVPSNAIYYLGENRAKVLAELSPDDHDSLILLIRYELNKLLERIYITDPHCFRDLLSYDHDYKLDHYMDHLIESIIEPPAKIKKLLSDIERSAGPDFEERSHILQIEKVELQREKDTLPTAELSKRNTELKKKIEKSIIKLDKLYMDKIPTLPLDYLESLFSHICMNLEAPLILNTLPKAMLEQKPRITLLKDLISQCTRFGRAHFQIPIHNLDTHLYKRL